MPVRVVEWFGLGLRVKNSRLSYFIVDEFGEERKVERLRYEQGIGCSASTVSDVGNTSKWEFF